MYHINDNDNIIEDLNYKEAKEMFYKEIELAKREEGNIEGITMVDSETGKIIMQGTKFNT